MINNSSYKNVTINPLMGYKQNQKIIELIEYGPLDDFISWAKEYNIFQSSTNKFYLSICQKVKDRLQKENLSLDIVRPEEK